MGFGSIFIYYSFNFFFYGFLGWGIENLYCYATKGHMQRDGFLFGPFKPMYAIAMTIILGLYNSISQNIFFLISICAIIPTTVEYCTGVIMRQFFNKNYWDYSNIKYNIQGIICLRFSVYWTILTFIGVKLFQPYFVDQLYNFMSPFNLFVISILIIGLILDDSFTMIYFKDRDNIE